jgi:hypothetical protein
VCTSEHGLTFGRELHLARSWPRLKETPPRLSSASADRLGNNSSRILKEATLKTMLTPPCTTACPKEGSTKASGGTSISPVPSLGLDNIDQRTPPTPPRRLLTTGWLQNRRQVSFMPYRKNYYALFTILITLSTTTTRTTPPSYKLGYTSEPQILASALCSVKMQI